MLGVLGYSWMSSVELRCRDAPVENCVEELKVVSDLAERGIRDIQEYADLAKDSKYKEDIFIVATEHRAAF